MEETRMPKGTPEDMVSDLMQYVYIETSKFPINKRFAVERYMRTFLRRLTKMELQAAIWVFNNKGILHPDIDYKMNQASEGYDKFMQKRGIPY